MRGGGENGILGAVQDTAGVFIRSAALETGVVAENVVRGSSGAGLRVRLVAVSSARGVRGSVGHALSPFQTGHQDGIVGSVALWQRGSGKQGCDFALTAAHLLQRRY